MTTDPAAWAAQLAEQLPRADVEQLAEATLAGRDTLSQLAAQSPAGVLRAASNHALRMVNSGATQPPFLAGALLAAATTIERQRQHQAVDVVWTGPPSSVTTGRLTSAVVVELLDSATDDVLLVSFATQTEPSVDAALRRAVDRGVTITLLLERPSDNPRYTASDPFPGLRARRLAWPGQNRPPGAAVHAKIIVVDRRVALVGSANITGHAMDHNLECGVLIRGGDQPARIHAHVIDLLDRGEVELS